LDPTDISHLVVAEEILVENVYDMTLLPFEPTVIVDCGAHIGMFTLLAAARFPKAKITCFEPNGSNAQWLKRQIANNRIAAEVIEAAVSTREGEASFSASCSCGGAIIHDKGLAGAVTVKMIRLADFLSTKQDSRLLLKLDLEGEEAAVLPDIVGRLPETCGIFLETHHGDESWSSAKRLLESHGFDVRTIRRRDIYTDGVAIRCPRS
jgi:FkbM family methyltransferase